MFLSTEFKLYFEVLSKLTAQIITERHFDMTSEEWDLLVERLWFNTPALFCTVHAYANET